MHCPFCNREPKEIPEYVQQAQVEEMSVEDYVRMDEGTYHPQTDLFCCTGCYIYQGMPSKTQLISVYRIFGNKVVPLESARK